MENEKKTLEMNHHIMNKSEIQNRIDCLNEYVLSDMDKKLLLLKLSNDYTYNKAITLVDKSNINTDWYCLNYKACYKSWNEIETYLDGLCKWKNTIFTRDIETER